MPIPINEAADLAKRFGLTLSDARSLAAMSDDLDHAETLAAKFAPGDIDEKRGEEIAARIHEGRR